MTAEILSAAAAILLSLTFSYLPKLNTWYAAQEEQTKKLVMLGAIAVVAAGSFALACAGLVTDLFGLVLTCDRAGALVVVRSFIFALMANQAAYLISPKTAAVKEVKALQAGTANLSIGKG